MIDDRTSNLSLPKPNAANTLAEDVARLRSALDAIDAEIQARQLVSEKGVAGGYAGLDGSGKVPAAQLPSFVDDVLEYADFASLPGTGEGGKIYVLLTPHTIGDVTSSQFRWTGSAYAPIVASPGTTDAVTEGSVNKYFTDARARAAQYIATGSQLGLIKVGAGLAIGGDGTLSTVGGGGGEGVPAFNELIITPTSNGQTVLTPAGGYEVGEIELFLNGVLLYGNGDDYSASNGTTITLTFGVSTTDLLLLRRWTTSLSFPFSSLTDKPTTLAGYGITDAVATSGDQTIGGVKTFSSRAVFGAAAQEKQVAIGASNIDLALGNYFTRTISGATALTVSNIPASGVAASFILDLTNGGSGAITWWANVKWAGGTAPTLTASGRDVLGFFTHNGGTTWTGLVLGKDVK